MRLYLVRHLQPSVGPGVCYGRSDLPVDAQLQADALAGLRGQLPIGIPLFSSPLVRCTSLANALCDDVRVDPRLAELDFGAWEMRRWDAIPRNEIDAWAADTVMYRPGGGESVFDMARRIDAFYADLLHAQLDAAAVVCHAGSIRLLAARVRGLDPLAMAQVASAQPHAIGYGEVVILDGV